MTPVPIQPIRVDPGAIVIVVVLLQVLEFTLTRRFKHRRSVIERSVSIPRPIPVVTQAKKDLKLRFRD
jgi:hypothetical protein